MYGVLTQVFDLYDFHTFLVRVTFFFIEVVLSIKCKGLIGSQKSGFEVTVVKIVKNFTQVKEVSKTDRIQVFDDLRSISKKLKSYGLLKVKTG